MSRCLTSDALSFPLNLQYNSLPIEKAARVPYPPQLMYLILSIFTLLFYPIPTHVQEKFSVPSIWSVVIVTSKPLSLILTSYELLRYIFALTQDTSLAMYPTLIIIVALLGLCNTFNMYKPPIPDVVT